MVRWHHQLSGRESGDWIPPPPPTQSSSVSDMQHSDSDIIFFLFQILFHHKLDIKYSSVCHTVVVVQSLTHVWLFVTHGLQHARLPCPSPSPRVLLKVMPIESVMSSSHLILCHPVLLLFSIFPSIKVFSNGLSLHIRWPKYWSFSFSISPSNEYSGLISFKMDWLDLLAVQGTLKSLLQHHSSKASVLWQLAFFMV